MPSVNYAALGVLYALLGFIGTSDNLIGRMVMAEPPQQTCPSVGEIAPCSCSVKKNGLDILCETTDISHINHAMTKLKQRNPIIFYLKLRHNNLPKLQGFVFLALDIRHLTIHNSSLAVIEETALSSLGINIIYGVFFLQILCKHYIILQINKHRKWLNKCFDIWHTIQSIRHILHVLHFSA